MSQVGHQLAKVSTHDLAMNDDNVRLLLTYGAGSSGHLQWYLSNTGTSV